MNCIRIRYYLLFTFFILCVFNVQAQHNTIKEVAQIMEVGNASDLAVYFNDKIDLNLEGNEGVYSRSQAEGVLKNYFKEHPPHSFTINHEGSSENGLVYAIGEYLSGEQSYRVWIRLKPINSKYKIHEISFLKE